jgi:NTP pyrophosphatase (non-canonical NTP hydrolase)
MGYGTKGLSFNTLCAANQERRQRETIEGRAYVKCKTWIPAQWMNALVGEVGELANILKKVDRGDFSLDVVRVDMSRELADIQAYLDILASELGINLGEATRLKFNEVSERIGSRVFIGEDDDWHLHK